MHLLQDLLEIVYGNYVQTIKSKLLFICLWLTVLSAVLQRDHGNQAKTKVQQLGLRQKSFASGLAIIPPLFGWIYYSRRPKEAFLQCLCLSLRHGAETVTPRVHCTRVHCVTMTIIPIMSPVTRLTGSLHTPVDCGQWEYHKAPVEIGDMFPFLWFSGFLPSLTTNHSTLLLMLVKRLLCIW